MSALPVRVPSPARWWPVAFGIFAVGALATYERYLRANTIQTLVASLIVPLLPIAAYVAVRSPLVMPFCLYVVFMPFDSLSSLGSAGTLTKLLGLVSAAAIGAHVLRRGNFVVPPRALVCWLALLGLMCASVLWSIEPRNATAYLQMYASLIALYALLSVVRVEAFELDAILGATVLAGLISAGFNAYLFRNNQDVIDAGAGVSRVIISSGTAAIDPNELAFALVLPFTIALYWLFNSRYVWLRAAMLPVLAIHVMGFSASGSRGGFVALAAAFAYLIVRSRHRAWLGMLLVGSCASALAANPTLPARFVAAQQDGAAGRVDIWRVGVRAFREHWLYGAGVGNFLDAFNHAYIHVFVRYVLGWNWVAHNVPLTIATELGVIGLAVYALAFVMQLRSLEGFCAGTRRFELRLALEASCIGIFVAGLSTSTLNAKFAWLAFSLMSLLRGSQIAAARATRTPRRREGPSPPAAVAHHIYGPAARRASARR